MRLFTFAFPPLFSCVFALCLPLQAGEIGFGEEFALSDAREKALSRLVPGSVEYFRFKALDLMNSGRLDEASALLDSWFKSYGNSNDLEMMRNRLALLQYPANHGRTLDYLKDRLGLSFSHSRLEADAVAKMPNGPRPGALDFAKRLREALASRDNTLSRFSDSALALLDPATLSPERRRAFLRRIQTPDYPNLPEAVVADLSMRDSGGFGSLPVHSKLTLPQYEACAKLMPKLLMNPAFVDQILLRLRPDSPDWEKTPASKAAAIDRIWSFVKTLDPSFNSLKACVLFKRLETDMEAGVVDKPRFMEYVRLPRRSPFASSSYLRQNAGVAADLGSDLSEKTGLPAPKDERALLTHFLSALLADAADYSEYAKYLDERFVKTVFAEAKILSGSGDAESFFALLSPAERQALKERVDVELVPDNKRFFKASDKVSLGVFVKNAPRLTTKTFAVDLSNFYKSRGEEPGLDLDLSGVVPLEERDYDYNDSPFLRTRRDFEFPALKERGTYIVEFSGNGKVGRALIAKGSLSHIAVKTAAGWRVVVSDEDGKLVKNPKIWMEGRLFEAGKDGVLLVPYSSSSGVRKAILYDGAFCSLADFAQEPETYSLGLLAHLDREALIAGAKVDALIGAKAALSGTPIPASLLKNVRLTARFDLIDGSSSTRSVDDFKLEDSRESLFQFYSPAGLKTVAFKLEASVANLSKGVDENLSAERVFHLNGVDSMNSASQLILSRDASGYLLRLLGKNGEPIPGKAVACAFSGELLKETYSESYASDANGEIHLGLPGYEKLSASCGPIHADWPLSEGSAASVPSRMNLRAGEYFSVPSLGREPVGSMPVASLLKISRDGEIFLDDLSSKIHANKGVLNVPGLPAGAYVLLFRRTGERVSINVFDGHDEGLVVAGESALAEKSSPALSIAEAKLALTSANQSKIGSLTIKLENAVPGTRVHVFADRFAPLPGFDPFAACASGVDCGPSLVWWPAFSRYESNRVASEEYEYILARRKAPVFAGNMLERPGLLLNPFALRKTNPGVERQAVDGEGFGGAAPSGAALAGADLARAKRVDHDSPLRFSPSFDFLAKPSASAFNLTPDKDGNLVVPVELALRPTRVCVLALGPNGAAMKNCHLPERKAPETRDLRLAKALDSKRNIIEAKTASSFAAGDSLEIKDYASARYEIYDSVPKLFALFSALSKGKADAATLGEFAFLANWDKLSDAEKLEKYSKYSCHELNFFLYRKDRAFFDKVVAPYLAKKRAKTFMDDYLLGCDLRKYLALSDYANDLNAAEKALLAARVQGEAEESFRYLNDLVNSRPSDPAREDYLFRMALSASATSSANASPLSAKGATLNGARLDRAKTREEKSVSSTLLECVPQAASAPTCLNKAFSGADLKAKRESMVDKQLFRKLDKTEELAENNYWKLPFEKQNSSLIPVDKLWVALAKDGGKLDGFRSAAFPAASSNFHEMALTLGALDLPFAAAKTEGFESGANLTLKFASPAIVFRTELVEAAPRKAGDVAASVARRYFLDSDRYEKVDGRKIDKFVSGVFRAGEVYGCMVVVANPSSAPVRLELLNQIPAGAIPVGGALALDSRPFVVPGFRTQVSEYRFYFPKPGDFAHYPARLSEDGRLVASSEGSTLKVVDAPPAPDTKSWSYVSQYGSDAEVLDFLSKANLNDVELSLIAFRMKDASFYKTTMAFLRRTHVYNEILMSYSIRHDDPATMREYLPRTRIARECGPSLDSEILKLDPVRDGFLQFLEYAPLVNARCGILGRKRSIANEAFYNQYGKFLDVLCYKAALSDEDRLGVCYYLLLQDRVAEALAQFARIDPAKVAERMQYDYCAAYLHFSQDKASDAAKIAAKYKEYPVSKWRNRFLDILAQAAEADGASASFRGEGRDARMGALASAESSISLRVDGPALLVEARNAKRCVLNYYLMDVEFLFSKSPFAEDYGRQFGLLMPNRRVELEIPKDGKLKIAIAKDWAASNFLVEAECEGKKASALRFANDMDVELRDSFGQLKIARRADGRPLPKAYVKVYAKCADGQVRFYKDGYSDLRGRFDYASLSSEPPAPVEKFSILVMGGELGSAILEALPPSR